VLDVQRLAERQRNVVAEAGRAGAAALAVVVGRRRLADAALEDAALAGARVLAPVLGHPVDALGRRLAEVGVLGAVDGDAVRVGRLAREESHARILHNL
jgi:hypothetical protein